MASVTSLDQDMRNLRLSRYTPQAANEVRNWIEQTLQEPIASGDLLDALKDGVALCKLANLVLPAPGIRYKTSSMPFVQMENISHFLKACEIPPLSMPAHDRFLTVDLYESKDPAQVLQCLKAFSRQAHIANPTRITETLGPRRVDAGMTDYSSSTSVAKLSTGFTAGPDRQQGDGTTALATAPAVTTWSNRSDEGSTLPAWNIHQYGYMGGASQGNQGVSFGARRQITSQPPKVPSLAEKEKLRREKVAVEERERQAREDAQRRRQADLEAEEARERELEERRFEEETKKLRDEERLRIEDQKRRWAEEEKIWRDAEEARKRDKLSPADAAGLQSDKVASNGQILQEHRQERSAEGKTGLIENAEQLRVKELEKQLEEARERERQYLAERAERATRNNTLTSEDSGPRPNAAQMERPASAHNGSEASWTADEREQIRTQGQVSRESTPVRSPFQRPPPTKPSPFSKSRYTNTPVQDPPSTAIPLTGDLSQQKQESVQAQPQASNRTSRFLSAHDAPVVTAPRISSSREAGDTSLEQALDRDCRIASQTQTKAGGWASKSLLEREMERERERQREWEANQEALKSTARDSTQGVGAGQSWDVNQYGYMGKDVDNMNRGSSVGSGINIGGRRPIIGPRPQK